MRAACAGRPRPAASAAVVVGRGSEAPSSASRIGPASSAVSRPRPPAAGPGRRPPDQAPVGPGHVGIGRPARSADRAPRAGGPPRRRRSRRARASAGSAAGRPRRPRRWRRWPARRSAGAPSACPRPGPTGPAPLGPTGSHRAGTAVGRTTLQVARHRAERRPAARRCRPRASDGPRRLSVTAVELGARSPRQRGHLDPDVAGRRQEHVAADGLDR